MDKTGAAWWWARVLAAGALWAAAQAGAVEAAPPAAPALVGPSGVLAGTTHAFTWEAVPGATWYQLWLNDATASPRLTRWYTAAQARCAGGAGSCFVVLGTGLAAGRGRWFVAAWNPDGQTWSTGLDILVQYAATAWSHTLAPPARFQPIGSQGILDRETGLVWLTTFQGTRTWTNAMAACLIYDGNQVFGWRLPTIEELATLVDSAEAAPALPPGHPFSGVSTTVDYWSATTDPRTAGNTMAMVVSFRFGTVSSYLKTDTRQTWCVRGGAGVDGAQ